MKIEALILSFTFIQLCTALLPFSHFRGKSLHDCRLQQSSQTIASREPAKLAKFDVELFLKDTMDKKPGSSFVYSVNSVDHILDEGIPYDSHERVLETTLICESFQTREKERSKVSIDQAKDKRHNPLVAITGSPGCGKSAYLAHFPASEAYQDYLGKRGPPVVSSFTFNGAMAGKEIALGLRILFGAARCMGVFSVSLSWLMFCEMFQHENHISALDAVLVLKRIFGQNRPLLIAADEINQALRQFGEGNDRTVVASLTDLLSLDGNIDILVTSLSPQFIYELVTTSSRRDIEYIALRPAIDFEYGKQACKKWANIQLMRFYNEMGKMPNQCVQNLLYSSYLLVSGHFRSLERLLKAYENPRSAINKLKNNDLQDYCSLLEELAAIVNSVCKVEYLDENMELLEKLVLTSKAVPVTKNIYFRTQLENGHIHIQRSYNDVFFLAIKMCYLVQVMNDIHNPDVTCWGNVEQLQRRPLCSAFKALFFGFGSDSIADTWERAVDMTIISRSYSSAGLRLKSIFGIQLTGDISSAIYTSSSIQKSNSTYVQALKENSMSVPPKYHPGYDSLYFLQTRNNKQLYVYVQAKIMNPSKSILEVLAKSIVFILDEHFSSRILHSLDETQPVLTQMVDVTKAVATAVVDTIRDAYMSTPRKVKIREARIVAKQNAALMDNVHIVFYNWGSDGTEIPTMEMVRDQVKLLDFDVIMQNSKFKTKDLELLSDEFIKAYFENVHLVSRPEIKQWLLPSFLPIAEMANYEAIEGK